MVPRDRISLGILAGGRGSRLGGVDKAFLELGGVTLLERALSALGTGFASVLVSHNRPDAPQRSAPIVRDLRFVGDARAAGEGPLAGLDALLHATDADWLLSLPVDLAEPSAIPVQALLATRGAVVRDADGLQPLVALWPVAEARAAVRAALLAANRAVHPLAGALGLAVVDIAPACLGNLNTPDELRRRA